MTYEEALVTNITATGQYQLLPPLREVEYDALKRDIQERGLMVPVELDEEGAILDGHHRVAICTELGIDWRSGAVTRRGWTEAQKRLHVRKINILRRHLDKLTLGEQIEAIAAELGVKLEERARNDRTGANVASVAVEAGVSKRTAQYALAAKRAVESQPEIAEKLRAGEIGPREAIREAKQKQKQEAKAAVAEEVRQQPLPPPTGPFGVIVIDPPWKYEKRVDDTTHRARLPYPEMDIDEIAALPVPSIAEPDALLWLWTTNAFMHDAYHLIERWGFTAKTVLTWAKDRMGTGDWLRGKTEHCILAVRGRPLVTLTNQTTLLSAPLREHSRKPDEFYALVDALCPGSKVDLFAREARMGWATWGAEAGKFDG